MSDFRLRVTYAKAGRLCMLSHLEICRALERCVRRAGLPYAISQGFSPHMKIAFGAALPVGVGGAAEIYDVQLTEWVNPNRALEALRAASPADLAPYKAEYIGKDVRAASVMFPLATYRAVLDGPASGLNLVDEVTVVRKKKTKVLRVSDFLVDGFHMDGNQVTFTLESKPTGSLRADLLMEAMMPEGLLLQNLERVSQAVL